MIRVENLTKRFGSRLLLDGASASIAPAEVTVLEGPSGCGKSTLLRCINGLEAFEAGAVRAFDVELGPHSDDSGDRATRTKLRALRMRVGLVFQHYALFPHMTALANVMEAPLHVLGKSPVESREQAESLLERVGLAERRHAHPRDLSGGEQQRVAIARALAVAPRALMLDEPTSALDPARKVELGALLAQLAASGTTLLVVSHEAGALGDIAKRVLTLRNGKLVEA